MRLRHFHTAAALACPVLACAVLLTATAEAAPTPAGTWLTQDREGAIEISPCGAGFCGRIVAMAKSLGADGLPMRDHAGRPKCGQQILVTDALADGKWPGHITDPDDGSVWTCEISVDAEGNLHLRGYVLTPFFGKTQIWHPFAGKIGANCAIL